MTLPHHRRATRWTCAACGAVLTSVGAASEHAETHGEEQVTASERARLDQIRICGEIPRERLLELYSTPPRAK